MKHLDESVERAHGDRMDELIREHDETERALGDEFWDFGPERVTVTTTPDIHAAQEALNVAVFRWVDEACDSADALDRVRWQAAQLRSAMEQGDQL